MFIHNLKYTIKTLFLNRILVFWTIAFPIILGIFFKMAFSSIESDEALNVFDIAVIDNENYRNNDIYKKTFEQLSSDENENKLFNITYADNNQANRLLDDNEIEGYIEFIDETPKLVFKKSGIYPTIMKSVVQEIEEHKKIITSLVEKESNDEINKGNYNFNVEEIVLNINNKINTRKAKLTNISNSNMSYTMIEYFSLIAMACMYCATLGMTAINQSLANMDNKGRRVAIAPTKKSTIVLSAALASYLVSLVGISLLLLFLKFIIKVDFGDKVGYIILLSLVGDLAGIAFGIFIASVFKFSEGTKTGLIIAISMAFSVLSGMVGITLKYYIDKNIAILNLINPNAMITDGFYSLYYYDTLNRYVYNLVSLIVFIIVCLGISAFKLRRQRYDSI